MRIEPTYTHAHRAKPTSTQLATAAPTDHQDCYLHNIEYECYYGAHISHRLRGTRRHMLAIRSDLLPVADVVIVRRLLGALY